MDFNIPTPTLLEISIKLHYIYLNFVVLEISSFPWNFQAGRGGGRRIQRSFWWNYTMSLSLRLLALLQHALREGIINRLLVNPFLYPFPKYGEDYTYASMQKTEFMALRKQGKLHTLENNRLKLREDFKCLGSSDCKQFLINFKRHTEVRSEFGVRWQMEL